MNLISNANRIFCFGCSWTNYRWPSWADMCRYSADVPVYNWGLAGLGNVGIFYRLLEADLKHKFTDKDIILIQWSTWSREDRFFEKWGGHGSVHGSSFYNDGFVKKYWSWNNDIVKNSSVIIAASKMFNISFQFTWNPIYHLPEFSIDESKVDHTLFSFYKDFLPNMCNFPLDSNSFFEGTCLDSHPDIKSHLEFFETHFVPLGFDINRRKSDLLNLHYLISKKLNKTQSLLQQFDILSDIMKDFDPAINNTYLGF